MTMTPEEDAKAPAAAAAAMSQPHPLNTDTAQGGDPTDPSSSSSKGIIATLAGAAMQLATSIRAPASTEATTSPKISDAMETEKDERPSEYVPPFTQDSIMDDIADDSTIGSAIDNASLSLETTIPPPGEGTIEKSGEKGEGVVRSGGKILPPDDGGNDADSVEVKIKNVKSTVGALAEKRLGEELDIALDALHESISVAILAHQKDQENAANLNLNDEEKKKSNDAYATLRHAAVEAHHSLVAYGSSMDLRSQGSTKDDGAVFLSDVRRSRLLDIGRNLWMAIRNNPELFNDVVAKADGGDFASFEGKKNKAVAGGYARDIAARLVFLNYIRTRCSTGCPPVLQHAPTSRSADNGKTPSLQELVFGLKLFSRAGRAILDHNRKDARSSYDSLSLAASCFDAVSAMAANGNGEAASQLKGLFDEAFDAISMLPNAASLFGETRDDNATNSSSSTQVDGNNVPWQSLVLRNLERVESFVDDHCNVFKTNTVEESQSTSKLATLQRFLPFLARLCYKHGSHFVKLREYDNAGKALHIALKSTNSCLSEIRQELEQGQNRKAKGKQILHNLEAELVVVSIEAFYLLSVSYQSSGEKGKALMCLDRIEAYMKEQHDRDNELHSNVMNRLSSGKDFVFSEGGATSVLEGPKNHFDKDKADIKNRAQTALEDAKNRHAAEKATLAFSRIMIFHKTMPCPSLEEESLIDQKMKELVELSLKFTAVSSSDFGSAQHAVTAANQLTSSVNSKATRNDKIFDLTLQVIRLVHVRRTISKVAGADSETNTYADNYKLLLEKLPKAHFRRPCVMLDRLNAMLAAEYQVRERKLGTESIRQLDNEALSIAKEYLESVKAFFDKSASTARGNRDTDTTLFVTSSQSLSNDLFEETKLHFARAVSLYHSLDAHDLCAQWSDLLQSTLQLKHDTSLSLEDSGALLGQVMTVKAYALSMSGNHASGMKTAREAWEKVKTVDSMVNLFHCSLRHELKYHSCDTMLEFDAALNELLSLSSDSVVDECLAAFPRLVNSCVENEVSGGELVLLGVQERWIDMLVSSKTFNQHLKEKDISVVPQFSLFNILRAYLNNFEHVVSLKKDHTATARNFEAFGRIVDGVLKLLVQVREKRLQKRSGRRKKREIVVDTNAGVDGDDNAEFVLLWDDISTKKLVGDRSDSVWTAEQLWNIGNQLMAVSLGATGDGDARGIAADAFAASHDFCLMSEEEEGQSLSKGYLDFDVKFDPTKTMLPNFERSNERPPCDISSEFSGQCLLVSVATAVDYAAECMHGGGKGDGSVNNEVEVQILLSRSLHRLAQAQEELQLNCEDEQQRSDANKMIVLLALRCLLGVGEDSLAYESLKSNGLYDALHKIHLDEISSSNQTQDENLETQFVTLRNVKLMADLAEERKMHQTSRCLQRLCAQQLSQTGKFVLDIGDYEMSLGEIQKNIIQSASSAKDVLEVYDEIDALVEKHRKSSKEGKDDSFYSGADLTWFAKDANNRAVQHDLLGDDQTAAKLFATALNLLPLCGQDLQCHAQGMNAAYQQVISRMTTRGDSLSSIWNLISE